MSRWILLLTLVMSAAQAAPPNTYRTPSCFSDVRELPIYNLIAKLKETSELEINSSVVLIGKDLWRTTAHSVGYNMDAHVTIITPTANVVATVWLMDIGKDVAYLHGDSGTLIPIPPSSKNLALNEPVWNIGFPGLFDRRLISVEGMYARTEKDGNIVVSAIGYGGMSGGASVRCNGKRLEMVGTIKSTNRAKLSEKVWTDEHGVLHVHTIYVNFGFTNIAPIKE